MHVYLILNVLIKIHQIILD